MARLAGLEPATLGFEARYSEMDPENWTVR